MPYTQLHTKKLIIIITSFTLLIISLVWIRLWHQHKDDYKANVNAAVQRNTNLAVALEQYTIRTLRNADAVLQLVRQEYAKEGRKINIATTIKEHSLNTDFFSSISIIDEKGILVTTNWTLAAGTSIDFKDEPTYQYHLSETRDTLFISKPTLSKLERKDMIFVSRRIYTPSGVYGGIVELRIAPSTFTRFYADAEIKPNDILSLVAPDGITYSRRTGKKDSYGEDIHKSPLFAHVAKKSVGSYFSKDAIRGIPTYFSYRRLRSFPIIATVGTSEEDALANYTEDVRRDYVFASLISLLILLFSAVIGYTLLHRKRILKKVKESEIKYRSIVNNTKDIILLIHTNGSIKAANPAACKAFLIKEETLLHTSFLNLVAFHADEDRSLILEKLQVTTFEKELSFVRSDGSLFVGEMVSTLHTNATNEHSIIIIIRDITERKRMAEKLIKEQRRFQRRLTRQVIQAQEREREEIGRELHDNVNQVLTTVKLYLEMAATNSELSQALVTKSTTLIMESINEIRSLSHSLSAPTLGTNSIIDSINALIESVKPSAKFQIHFSHNTCTQDLSKEQKLAIYRIIQEQLNNVIKHADASIVWITLAQSKSHTLLTVKDNGKGFDAKALRSGIGLNNIISRAKAFEGSVQIKSQPEQGTALIVSLPFIVSAAQENPVTFNISDDFSEVY
jgi:PAS domain S-box-containing protein